MKISAYIPAFNKSASIAGTIASIRAQSHPVDELFVVDDNSRDGTAETATSLGVKVIKQSTNTGRGAVRARAMAEAGHEYVLCCDAGKTLDPDFVKNAVPWLDDTRVAAVFGWITQGQPENAVERWRGRHLFKDQPIAVIHGAKLVTAGALCRASAIKETGNYASQLRYGEDLELGIRLLAAGFDVVCDPALQITSGAPNTLAQVLERYWRWNTTPDGNMDTRAYLRQISYSLKVMAREDLKAGDFPAALISLLTPHYQFLRELKNSPRR